MGTVHTRLKGKESEAGQPTGPIKRRGRGSRWDRPRPCSRVEQHNRGSRSARPRGRAPAGPSVQSSMQDEMIGSITL
ncbi:hypothetical protein NDU88_000387 [Pleurodeles waltl]|uniref:Uncharacterized protein n=1 Tax=Pleurodeles waltl TaxID=8319 RepID=A0AAV7V8V0_PLEWA|nr:hypothetical protein NDU88_000387 [Pleurodeles waltl]